MCGVIVVDAESFRSTWHGRDAYIHDHFLRYRHNFTLFYQLLSSNLFTTLIHAILRETTSETYGPGVYFTLYKFPIYNSSFLSILFCNLYFPIYTTKIKKIFILLSLLDLPFLSGREGIENTFIALVARFLIVCAGTRRFVCSLLLDWYLGSQKQREILTLLCCITLSSSRENQRRLKR